MTPEERVRKCSEMFAAALEECGCVCYTAIGIGNAEAVLTEIAGLPILVKIATNDSQVNSDGQGTSN